MVTGLWLIIRHQTSHGKHKRERSCSILDKVFVIDAATQVLRRSHAPGSLQRKILLEAVVYHCYSEVRHMGEQPTNPQKNLSTSNTIPILPLMSAPKQHQGFAAGALCWDAGGLCSTHQAHRTCRGMDTEGQAETHSQQPGQRTRNQEMTSS